MGLHGARTLRPSRNQRCVAQGLRFLTLNLAGFAARQQHQIHKGPFYGFQVLCGEAPNSRISTYRITNNEVNSFQILAGSGVNPVEGGKEAAAAQAPFDSLHLVRSVTDTGQITIAIATSPVALHILGTVVPRDSQCAPTNYVWRAIAEASVTVSTPAAPLIAANPNRSYLYIQNQDTVEEAFLAFVGTATLTSQKLGICEVYETSRQQTGVTTGAVSAIRGAAADLVVFTREAEI